MATPLLSPKPGLPEWAETVRRKYLGGEASVFLLHGNVFDQLLHAGEWMSLESFLVGPLLGENKDNVVVFDPSEGLHTLKGPHFDEVSDAGALDTVETLLLDRNRVAAIVRYADSVAPAGDEAMLSPADRIAAVRLHRWSLSNAIAAKDNVVFLVAESLATLNSKLLSNPRVATIEIPLPDELERQEVIRKAATSIPAPAVARLAAQTSGLRAIHIRQILAPKPAPGLDDSARRALILSALGGSPDAEARADKLLPLTAGRSADEIRTLINLASPTPEDPHNDPYAEVLSLVSRRKREIIERECAGLIEFLDSAEDLSAFGGNEEIKEELGRIAADLRSGDASSAPMGLMVVGAMGTGKTFLVRCFAKTAGLTAVVLKNFRDKWVGSTESNLEKVLTMIQAMGPVLLVIDEGDRSFGSTSEDSDEGTSSRVMARLKEFSSDTRNRGRVVSVLMTNRPDRLDTDIKRAGRFDVKIPLFYPASADEVRKVVLALFKRHKIVLKAAPEDLLSCCAALENYSNADIEAVVLLARKLGRGSVDKDIFERAAHDYLPSRDAAMIEYMNLLAVFEASRRSWLPEKYGSLTPEQLADKLGEARRKCGMRALG